MSLQSWYSNNHVVKHFNLVEIVVQNVLGLSWDHSVNEINFTLIQIFLLILIDFQLTEKVCKISDLCF